MKDVLLPKSGCGKAGGRSMVEHILPNTSREASTEAQTSIYKASMGGPGLLIWTPCPSCQSSHTWAFNTTEAESGTNAWIKSKWQVLFRSGRIPYVATPHGWLNPDPPLYSCSSGRGSNSSILPCRISHTPDPCPQHSCTACATGMYVRTQPGQWFWIRRPSLPHPPPTRPRVWTDRAGHRFLSVLNLMAVITIRVISKAGKWDIANLREVPRCRGRCAYLVQDRQTQNWL